jgi:hypothetical protein
VYLHVDLREPVPCVELRQADDFRSLKVVALTADGCADRLAEAIAIAGTVGVDGDAYLRLDGLRRLSGERGADPHWLAGFDAMVDYARSRGWLTSGPALRAHCEIRRESAR